MFAQNNYTSTFGWKNTQTFQRLQRIFSPKVRIEELVSFVNNVTLLNPNIKLNRDEKRSGSFLIQWFEKNWDYIEPYFPYHEIDFLEINQSYFSDDNDDNDDNDNDYGFLYNN